MTRLRFALDDLGGQLRGVAREVSNGGQALLESALGPLLSLPRRGLAEVLFLRRAELRWGRYVAGLDGGFRFFSKPPHILRTVLDIDVSLGFLAAEAPLQVAAMDADGLQFRWKPAPFVWVEPTPEELGRYALPGAEQAETILLRIGPGGRNVLAVQRAGGALEEVLLWYHYDNRTLRVQFSGDTTPVQPFLALAESLRGWLDGRLPDAPARPLRLLAEEDLDYLLLQAGRAYCAAWEEVRSSQPVLPETNSILRPMAAAYDVTALHAGMLVRIDPDGMIAEQQNDDTFGLALLLRVGEEAGRPTGVVEVRPPDFIPSGELRRRLIESLRTRDARRELRKIVGISEAELDSSLSRPETEFVVFRTRRRKDVDQNVFVAPAEIAGLRATLIFSAEFKVDTHADPPSATFLSGSVRNLYDPGSERIGIAGASYFLHLIASVQHWMRVFQEIP